MTKYSRRRCGRRRRRSHREQSGGFLGFLFGSDKVTTVVNLEKQKIELKKKLTDVEEEEVAARRQLNDEEKERADEKIREINVAAGSSGQVNNDPIVEEKYRESATVPNVQRGNEYENVQRGNEYEEEIYDGRKSPTQAGGRRRRRGSRSRRRSY